MSFCDRICNHLGLCSDFGLCTRSESTIHSKAEAKAASTIRLINLHMLCFVCEVCTCGNFIMVIHDKRPSTRHLIFVKLVKMALYQPEGSDWVQMSPNTLFLSVCNLSRNEASNAKFSKL